MHHPEECEASAGQMCKRLRRNLKTLCPAALLLYKLMKVSVLLRERQGQLIANKLE